jgi:quercetin dioxygenase-like cupin family protein
MIRKAIHKDGRGTMRPYLVLVWGVAAIAGMVASVGIAWAQEPKLAPEGRGLLPKPVEMPAALGGIPPPHPFEPDPSGGFSRTIFETDEDPNFKLIIRDFSFPPDRQTHTVTLPTGAFLHILGGQGEISIAKQRLPLTAGARTAVPAGAPIDVVNNGEQPVVVRALIVEAK